MASYMRPRFYKGKNCCCCSQFYCSFLFRFNWTQVIWTQWWFISRETSCFFYQILIVIELNSWFFLVVLIFEYIFCYKPNYQCYVEYVKSHYNKISTFALLLLLQKNFNKNARKCSSIQFRSHSWCYSHFSFMVVFAPSAPYHSPSSLLPTPPSLCWTSIKSVIYIQLVLSDKFFFLRFVRFWQQSA